MKQERTMSVFCSKEKQNRKVEESRQEYKLQVSVSSNKGALGDNLYPRVCPTSRE